jgi:teichuronic acid biosynthesis glycosyltransferase TuaG
MLPKVSIVIPFYNCPYINQAIYSALLQTYPNVEVIVVSDGSWMHINKLQPFLNRIRYIHKSNGGTASALNTGIMNATGAYIAWLSSDDVFYPKKLANQMSFMLAHKALISFTNYDLINSEGHITQRSVGVRFPNVIKFYKRLIAGNTINGCTTIMKKELLTRFGLFNEALPFTHDYDLWLRIILERIDFYYLEDTLVKYRVHEHMGTKLNALAIAREIEQTKSRYQQRMVQLVDVLSREATTR